MTENLSHEFLAFSEALDDENELDSSQAPPPPGSDEAILLSLRHELRPEGDLSSFFTSLPSADFAKDIVKSVQEKIADLPFAIRFLMRFEHILRGDVLSASALKGLAAVGALGLTAAAISHVALGALASLLLLASITGSILLRRYLPLDKNLLQASIIAPSHSIGWLNRLFYLLPTAGTLAVSFLLGKWVSSLADVSLSFKYSHAPVWFTWAGFAVAALWLLYASLPLWNRWEQSSRGKGRFLTLGVQYFYGLALLFLVTIDFNLGKGFSLLSNTPLFLVAIRNSILWGAVLVLVVGVVLMLRAQDEAAEDTNKNAWRILLRRLSIGAIPIIAMCYLSYSASLTRTIKNSHNYNSLLKDVSSWASSATASPAPTNQELELLYSMFEYPHQNTNLYELSKTTQRAYQIRRDFGIGGGPNASYETLAAAWNTRVWAKEDYKSIESFTKHLPLIELMAASSELTEGLVNHRLSKTRYVNYNVVIRICQGLAVLTKKELNDKNFGRALYYQRLNLKCLSIISFPELIDLGVRYNAEAAALINMQQLVFEGDLSRTQLQDLQRLMISLELSHETLKEVIKREILKNDRHLAAKAEGESEAIDWSRYYKFRSNVLNFLMPKSYWESERKAYLNFELDRISTWGDLLPLSLKSTENRIEESSPWGIAISAFSIDAPAAISSFLISYSRYRAMELVVALELYHRDHKAYPESLSDLVPHYLAKLPIDGVDSRVWKLKGGFGYQKVKSGYRLSSSSPIYVERGYSRTQFYGPLDWKRRYIF